MWVIIFLIWRYNIRWLRWIFSIVMTITIIFIIFIILRSSFIFNFKLIERLSLIFTLWGAPVFKIIKWIIWWVDFFPKIDSTGIWIKATKVTWVIHFIWRNLFYYLIINFLMYKYYFFFIELCGVFEGKNIDLANRVLQTDSEFILLFSQ